MARNFGATTDKLQTTTYANPSTTTGTVSLWWKPSINPGVGSTFRLWEYAQTGPTRELTIQRFVTGPRWYCGWNQFGGDDRANFLDTGTFSSGVWVNIIMTWDTGASPHTNVYFDNVSKGSATGTLDTGTAFSTHTIGNSLFSNNATAPGDIADVAEWNRVLTSAERAMLVAGVSPLKIPGLYAYQPIYGTSDEIDLIGGNGLAVTGTTVTAHPPLQMPTFGWREWSGAFTAGGGGGGSALASRSRMALTGVGA